MNFSLESDITVGYCECELLVIIPCWAKLMVTSVEPSPMWSWNCRWRRGVGGILCSRLPLCRVVWLNCTRALPGTFTSLVVYGRTKCWRQQYWKDQPDDRPDYDGWVLIFCGARRDPDWTSAENPAVKGSLWIYGLPRNQSAVRLIEISQSVKPYLHFDSTIYHEYLFEYCQLLTPT